MIIEPFKKRIEMYRIEIDIEEQVLLQVLTFLNGLGTAQKLRKVSQPKTVQKA